MIIIDTHREKRVKERKREDFIAEKKVTASKKKICTQNKTQESYYEG